MGDMIDAIKSNAHNILGGIGAWMTYENVAGFLGLALMITGIIYNVIKIYDRLKNKKTES